MSYESNGTLRTNRFQPDEQGMLQVSDWSDAELTNVVDDDGTARLALATSTVDDFEDGDIEEYSGDTGSFTVDDTSPVYEGTYSLKHTGSNAGDMIYATATDLDSGVAPQPGDTLVVQVSVSSNWTNNRPMAQTCFFAQDTDNFYQANLSVEDDNPDQTKIGLLRWSGGSASVLEQTTGIGASYDTEYRQEITPAEDGTITYDLYEESSGDQVASLSHDEETYDQTAESIGFRTSGEPMTWDNARIVG